MPATVAKIAPTPVRNWTNLGQVVAQKIAQAPVIDMHTHLFDPAFGPLNLWGVDQLLNYHYLQAEYHLASRSTPEQIQAFNKLAPDKKADLIYRKLFLENSPVSEATRGVVTTLAALGLPLRSPDLEPHRDYFRGLTYSEYVGTVMKAANVESIVMTNDPFVPAESEVWKKGFQRDPRFQAALRIDTLFNNWETAQRTLEAEGFGWTSLPYDWGLVQRFLGSWADRMNPVYLAASLPPNFKYEKENWKDSHTNQLLDRAILPFARERNLPVGLMVGVNRGINPLLGQAGDGSGQADLTALQNLLAGNPDVRFMALYLSRENQHELAVLGRKFPNLLIFGCWWFLNNPSQIKSMTELRLELLGQNFVPQHSDARVLDQLMYKWPHSRAIIAEALTTMYQRIPDWPLNEEDIERDVARLFRQNFLDFTGRK